MFLKIILIPLGIVWRQEMLQKIIIKMKCVAPTALKGYGGTEIHGWFFNYLKEISLDLSTSIHNMDEKPFAIGPIHGGKKERGKTIISEDSESSFSLASLNQEVYDILKISSADLIDKEIQLGNGKFVVTEVVPIWGKDGLTYLQILEKARINSEINLEFRSPTSFRQRGIQEVFPLPDLVFGSLLRRWNTFSPIILSEEMIHAKIFISRYNLKTELVNFDKYKIVGFTGNCTYKIDKYEFEHTKKLLHSLAAFANIASIGYKTSMGLGDSRYI